MRVLVVDDNEGLRKVLTALLVSAGHEVVATLVDGNGVEEVVAREKPDFVFLDYQLPGRDGLEILASVNAMAPTVDVLFMTASSEPEIEQRAADAGAAGFIRKPFSQAQIIDELRDVTEARDAARRSAEAEAFARSAAEGVAPDSGAPSVPAANPLPGGRRTAVIADDSGAVRLVLKGLLEESGVRVVQAVANGAEALNALRQHRPAMLCLDVNMPVMGGLEALEQARDIAPETAVVMVTGCADRNFVSRAVALGARGYILKPLRPAYVEGFVRKLFQPAQ
jgi:CheY-like chemotaxis protein